MLAPLLRYFIEVVRQGSVRGAAEKLHIAPSAVNRHILEFEATLGTALFERLPRGMRLTHAGELMFEVARKMQSDYDVALSEVDLLQQARRGHVTIATLQTISTDFFPQIVAGLIAEFPGITYKFFVGNTDEVVRLVVTGEADIGMCGQPDKGDPVRQVCKAKLPFGAVMLKSHPLAEYAEVRLRDCAQYPLIYPVSGELRALLDRQNAGSASKISPAIETTSIHMLRALVLSGAGIGVTSLVSVMGELPHGDLVFRPLRQQQRLSSVLSLLVREDRKLSIAASLLLDRLEAAFPSVEQLLDARN